ncbi:MAG: hypothetical protein ACR2OD_08630 [Gaiellaceae bacterium]
MVPPDDWRLTITLAAAERLPVLRRLQEAHLASTLRKQLEATAIVTHGDAHIYAYVTSEAAAAATEALAREVLEESDVYAEFVLERWHPIEQRWEPLDMPLPRSDEELAAEHARQQEDEAAAARTLSHAEWEIVVECDSHARAVELANTLTLQGLSVIRRWSYLIVGTATEDEAHALSDELAAAHGPNTEISVRPSGGMLLEVLPSSPLLIFSGIASHAGKEQ